MKSVSRRDIIGSMLTAPLLQPTQTDAFEFSVEGYIFQQYAERKQKPLQDVIAEVLPMAQTAGFRNIELNPAFFAPAVRDRTLSLLRSLDLRMPSIYVGGPMHSGPDVTKTIASALEYAQLAAPFGCKAVVHNPDPKARDQPKTGEELAVEARGLNRLAEALKVEGFDLRVHHHTPQLENNALEWRFILANTDPALVHICVDVDWAYEGGFEAVAFLREVGARLQEIHVRSARNKIWLEDVEDSDIDYRAVAAYLRRERLLPLVVVELAYRPQTVVTRSLEEDLRRSRIYTEQVFATRF